MRVSMKIVSKAALSNVHRAHLFIYLKPTPRVRWINNFKHQFRLLYQADKLAIVCLFASI